MRLIRLLRASVGPLVTLEMCQMVIYRVQRAMVRPSLLTSRGAGLVLEVVCELQSVVVTTKPMYHEAGRD